MTIDPDQLHQAVQEHCTEKEQEAIDLVWVRGYGMRKAATKLNVSRTTIKDRLESARAKLNRQGIEL